MRILVASMLCLSGCLSAPKLTAERVAQCVPMTFAYQNVVRDVPGPIRLEVDDGDPDFIELHVLASTGRIGYFRAWRDRRMEIWDWERGRWEMIGWCD